MKTIKVFLASSEELEYERLKFSDLVLQLNDLFERREIRLKLVKWERLDSSMGIKHKQKEYNDKLKECEMCLTLYWTKFGDYTTEELEIAYTELKEGRNPRKLYVFFKDAQEVSSELQQFKDSFAIKYGHFFCKFENVDTMRLQFLLQLEAYQSNSAEKMLSVENQKVLIEGEPVVDLNNVPFAAMNKEFVRLRDGIALCRSEIAQFDEILSQMENPAIEAMLKAKIAECNKLQEEFDIIQNALLNTAIRVAELKGEEYDDLLQRAIEAFEDGNLERTHTLLQEASLRVAQEREAYKLKKESLEADRSNLIKRIRQLLLDAEAVIGVERYSIEERIDKANEAYNEALLTAHEIDYDKKDYISLALDYALFANKYAKYDKAKELFIELIKLCEELYGQEHPTTATNYNNIGGVYESQGNYLKAREYYYKAFAIRENTVDAEHPDSATNYNNIGSVYHSQGDYPKALEYFSRALAIRQRALGLEHPSIATSYNNIGGVYDILCDFPKALEYYYKALDIFEKLLGAEHPSTATTYNNIGEVYKAQDHYPKALAYYSKALDIFEKVLGKEHPDTATIYNNIGGVYDIQSDYPKALEYYLKTLDIFEKALGEEHPSTATSYNNIGEVYHRLGNYPKAREYYSKSLAIREKVLGAEHPDTINTRIGVGNAEYRVGVDLYNKEFYADALPHLLAASEIEEATLGTEHINTASSYKKIAYTYFALGDSDAALTYSKKCAASTEAVFGLDSADVAAAIAIVGYISAEIYEKLEYHQKALSIRERILGEEDADTAQSYFDVGDIYIDLKDYTKALEHLYKSLAIRAKLLGEQSEEVATTCNNIGYTYNEMGEHQEAMRYHRRALAIRLSLFGEDAPQRAASYHNIGKTYNYLGDHAAAIEWLSKALHIRERELGAEDANTLATREEIEIANRGLGIQ